MSLPHTKSSARKRKLYDNNFALHWFFNVSIQCFPTKSKYNYDAH
jgi:hypothetical protein